MGKIIKITLITIISLIILIAISLTVLVNVVNPNDYKPQISKLVQDQTGRQLTINGNIGWSVFPWLGFKINNISLSNAAGFGNKPFLELAEADVRIKLIPLFSKKIEVGNLTLQGLQLNLERNAAGVTNWDDLIKKSNASVPQSNMAHVTVHTNTPQSGAEKIHTPQPGTSPAITTLKHNKAENNAPLNFLVSGVNIEDGAITWNDQQTGQDIEVKNINFTTHDVMFNQPFKINFAAELANKATQQTINLQLTSLITLSQDFASARLNNLSLKVNDLEINGDIDASSLTTNPLIDGKLNIPGFSLRDLSQSLGHTLTTQNPDAFKHVALQTAFSATQNSLTIKKLNLTLDDTNLTGIVTVNNFTDPAIAFNMQADQFNVDNYLPAKAAASAGTSQSNVSSGNSKVATTNQSKMQTHSTQPPAASPRTVSLSQAAPQNAAAPDASFAGLRKLNVQGKFSIGKLTALNLTATDASVAIAAKNGLLQIENLQANLYQGLTVTHVTVDVRKTTPAISVQSKFSNIQIQPFLTDFMHNNNISGTANLAINITAKGADSTNIMRTLNGNGTILLENGRLQGIDINYQIQRAQAMSKGLNTTAKDTNSTPFGSISGTAKIVNGIANNNDLKITTPIFSAKGAGTINLPQQAINYELKVTPNGGDLSKYTLGITFTGNMMSPNIGFDVKDIVQQAIKQQLQTNDKQLLQQGQKLLNGLSVKF